MMERYTMDIVKKRENIREFKENEEMSLSRIRGILAIKVLYESINLKSPI